jgi:AcrR family transcriptional regulator
VPPRKATRAKESAATGDTSSTTDKAGQGLRSDARRNRAKVLEAAQLAFADDGLAVSLDEIARRAGVGAGTVYRHFPSKEALFEAVIISRVQEHVAEAEALAGAGDAGEAFFGFLRHLIESGGVKRDLVDALTGAGADVSAVAAATASLRSAVESLLVRAQQAEAVRASIGIDDLMTLLAGTFLATQRYTHDLERRDRVWAVVFDGLRTISP